MNFYNEVLNVLKSDERFFSDDGQLLRNAVYEAAMQMDAKLIKALYANEETRKHFFTDVDGIAVFDKVGFGWVINNREFLPDSYTRYKNKIGLVNNKGEYPKTTTAFLLLGKWIFQKRTGLFSRIITVQVRKKHLSLTLKSM